MVKVLIAFDEGREYPGSSVQRYRCVASQGGGDPLRQPMESLWLGKPFLFLHLTPAASHKASGIDIMDYASLGHSGVSQEQQY